MKRFGLGSIAAWLVGFLASCSVAYAQGPFTTRTSITASGSTGNYTLTGTVSGPGSSTVYPIGSLSFVDTTLGGAALGSATLGAPVYAQTLIQKAPLGDGLTQTLDGGATATADFNKDGKMDIALANQGPSGEDLEIFLGHGDGTFGAETDVVLPQLNGNSNSNTIPKIAVGDFNGDGNIDVIITCSTTDVCILLGNGNGTFQTATIAIVGAAFPMALIAADFNGDGKLDIAMAISAVNDVEVWLGTGGGTFGAGKLHSVGTTYLAGIAAGDFNGDGKLDVIALDGQTSSGTITGGTATVCLGNGDGTFRTCTGLLWGGIRAKVGDFNGDGKLDVAFISGTSGNIEVSLGNGAGGFTAPPAQPPGGAGYIYCDIAVGDFNGDGKLDIAAVAPSGSTTEAEVYLGVGNGTFTAQGYSLSGNGPVAIASADLNDDGVSDLVIPNKTVQTTSIVLNSVVATSTATLFSVSPRGGGTHYVEASFPADASYQASTSGTVELTGTAIATTLTLQATPSSSKYGQQVSLSGILSPYSYETLSTNGEPISFYSNGSLLGSANLSSGVATLQTTSLVVGTDTLTAGYGTDGNFAASSATSSITVSSVTVTATASLSPSSQVYGGTPVTATVHVSCNSACGNVDYRWDGGEWGTVALDASGNFSAARPPTDPAGNHTIQINYLGNGTYAAVNSNVLSYSVSKATPTLSWATPSAITYGAALSAAQLSASSGGVAGTFTYTPAAGAILNAGTQTLSVNFTPSDTADFNTATATVSLVVNKAATSISIVSTVNPTTFGQNVSWPFTIGVAYGTIPSGDTVVYFDNGIQQYNTTVGGAPWGGTGLPAGTNNIYAVFQGDANYLAATSNTISQVVNKAVPTIIWPTPTSISYGTALSAAQFDATSSTPGTFAYTPASGTVLEAGTHALSVTFTPTDRTDYSTATATVSLAVIQATPTINWPNPLSISYGTPLSAVQLDATSSTPGTFTYTPAAGTVLSPGNQTLSVTFTPTNLIDYSAATATVPLTVNKDVSTITVSCTPSSVAYNQAYTCTGSVGAGATGSLTWSAGGTSSGTTTLADGPAVFNGVATAGAGTYTVTAAYSGDSNHLPGSGSAVLIITPATVTLNWNNPAEIPYGTQLSATQLNASSGDVPGTFTYTPAAGTILSTGTHSLSVLFVPANPAEYSTATATTTITVTRTPVNISVTSSLNPALFGMSVIFTIDFTGPAGAAIPTGTAELFDGEDNLGTVALDPLGHAHYVASSLKAGLHTLTVKYGGDPNYY